jgi:hypothetical protein
MASVRAVDWNAVWASGKMIDVSSDAMARVAIVPLSVVQVGFTAWYVCYLYQVENIFIRLLALFGLLVATIVIIILQASVYRYIAHVVIADDWYVVCIIAIQNLLSTFLIFMAAYRKRVRSSTR